jgi:GntR family transcriptional regulator, rspAB operon transcriptional repressor
MKTTAGIRQPQTTARWLQGEVRRAIIEMELAPGVRLSEQELAERYAVSRQPVREAMISLANDNLVDVRPQRGTFVSHLSLERMRESRLLREAIEVMIVRQACQRFDRSLDPAIEASLGIQRIRAEADDRAGFQAADEDFHALLARGAGFPHAWETIRDLKQPTDRVCKLTLASPAVMLDLVEQHRRIFDAVRRQASSDAARLMRRHLTEILRSLPDIKRRFPEWFG